MTTPHVLAMLCNKHIIIYMHICNIFIKKNPVLVEVSIIFERLLQQLYLLVWNQCSAQTETNQFICTANQLTGFFKKESCLQKCFGTIYHLFCRPFLLWQGVIMHFIPWHISFLFMTSFGIPSNWCYWSLYFQSIWLITKLL